MGSSNYLSPTFKQNQNRIRKLEKDGYKFYKLDKLTKITYKSISIFNPIFYKNHIYQNLYL